MVSRLAGASLPEIPAYNTPVLVERAARSAISASLGPSKPSYQSKCGKELAAPYRSGESPSFQEGVLQSSKQVWGDISFIYWQPFQDNMEIGLSLDAVSPIYSGSTLLAVSTNQSQYVRMDFDFMPGFKIGMGTTALPDNWDVSLEYTRLHGEDQKSSAGGAFGLAPTLADVGSMLLFLGDANFPYGAGEASWNIKLDFLDAKMGRSHFSGAKFTLHPGYGIRAAWIRQQLNGSYLNPSNNVLCTLNTISTLASWGFGPRANLDGCWMVGSGIRFYGNAEADLLYTRYHWNYQSTTITPALLTTPFTFSSKEEGIDTIRAHLDLEVGLGWGTSFHKDQQHFDLSAGYGFQVFFNQNMFKSYFATGEILINYAPLGNLYTQGMNLKAKCDF